MGGLTLGGGDEVLQLLAGYLQPTYGSSWAGPILKVLTVTPVVVSKKHCLEFGLAGKDPT